MADDFDINQYIKSNTGEKAPEEGFNVDNYIKDNEHHANEFDSSMLNPKPQPSIPETIAHQGAQGATLGFSDELTGVGAGAAQLATGDYGPTQNEGLLGKGRSWEDIKNAYIMMRDVERAKLDAQQEAHPIISTGANIIGGIPTAVATGGTSLAGAVGLGAAAGLGSSQQDIANDGLEAIPGALQDTAMGAGLGAAGFGAGKVLGYGASKILPTEKLEVAGSKMASKAVGIKPAKELAREYSQELGKTVEGSDIIKGIGKTAMDEGALPMTGGAGNIYDKSLEAIENQYNKLNPLMASTQQKLAANPAALDASGHIGDKSADFLYNFRNSLAQNPNQDVIMKKLEEKYIPYIQKMSAADGDLTQLTQFKRALQETATDLSKAAYDQPASDLKPEADFVKRLGGIVRQHIEDVASAADPGAGQQIGAINKTLSNLYTYKDAAKNLMNKSSGDIGVKELGVATAGLMTGHPLLGAAAVAGKYGIEKATGNPIKRLAQMGAAKALNSINTPAGQLVQKSAVAAPLAVSESPWNQKKVQTQPSEMKATKLSSSLYNATDDSLKEVAVSMAKEPGLQFYAEHLNKAIDTDDQGEKNRAIFLILQNPKSRRLITPKGK